MNVVVMVSGNGSNMQAIIDAIEKGRLPGAEIVMVISSNASAYALERAKNHNIPYFVAGRTEFPVEKDRTAAILAALKSSEAELIVLAGYMSILAPDIIRAYEKRIINIHPSLIPKHCGMGYFGMRVHESVLRSGDRESGATVHFVDEGVDTGQIIIQDRVPVLEGDDADTLAARVLETEHRILVKAINMIRGKYK
ncbi:phosphoribosylglycinamide formyltransferase [Clostridia bacterium]|nr:phosphoribosylglycinamide formyltransferase [Clostridia bacterium]